MGIKRVENMGMGMGLQGRPFFTRSLDFDAQKGSFTPGEGITQQPSGAVATIYGVVDAGATGTLILKDIVGAFVNNQIIYESALGGELCVNPTFDTDTWWAHADASLTIAGGNGIYTDAPQFVHFSRPALLTLNRFYKSQVDVLNYVEGNILASVGGDDETLTGADTYTLWSHATVNTNWRLFAGAGGTANNYNIDNVSIKEITNAALANGTVY